MKNLKKKIFILLNIILSTILLVSIFAYNISFYKSYESKLKDEIMRMDTRANKNDRMFIPFESYLVTYDENKNITNIENYSYDDASSDDIKNIINNINISNIKDSREGFTGNLYFDDYIYSLKRGNNLLIIKNNIIKNNLINALVISLIIIIIFELIIIIISKLLTNWIVKPVEDSFDKQKNFIYDASHELKTPIAVILASVETLEKNPKETKWLDNIKSETLRMSELVKRLLELSKSENITNNNLKEENLSKIVENRALTFESLAFEQNLKIKESIEDDITFKCDPEEIKEVLNILLDNALKHAYKKSTININLYKERKNIIIEVINKGDPIKDEDIDKIFDRFYRGDKSRNRQTNRYGLGLAIAKNIITNYNGIISVKCENGYTKFTIKF